ncbi:hypothetical protein JCM8097_008957 [Rhodosporidiobolus ruineniae]
MLPTSLRHAPRTRKLALTWLALAFLYTASAVVLIAVAQVWRTQSTPGQLGKHTLRGLVAMEMHLTAATALGVALLVVLLLGVLGFVQGWRPGSLQRKEAKGLIGFAWALAGTMMTTLVVASILWFYSLRERNNFRKVWLARDGPTQVFLQDKLQCCGYFNASSAGLFTQPVDFCAPFGQPGANATQVQGCVTPIVKFADFFLNNVFTTIYGFTSIQLALFLTTLCLIISRRDDERFRIAWEKHGGVGSAFGGRGGGGWTGGGVLGK